MQPIRSGAILIDGNDSMARPLAQWRRTWFSLTVIGASLATVFDLLLLQKKHSLFTDGFLSEYTLSGAPDVLGFIFMSWFSDVAILGPTIGILLVCLERFGMRRPGLRFIVLCLALSPIVLSNVVRYRLAAYLGDAFDLSLMLDLVGGRPLELFAVGFNHILPLLLFVMGGICIIGWWVWRSRKPALGSRIDGGISGIRKRIFVDLSLLFISGLILVSFVRIQNEVFDNGLKRKPSGRLLEFVAETLSDVDRDGYGLLSRPSDPAPFNAQVFPYALDLPGNGIDEDGIAGDLPRLALEANGLARVGTPWKHRPNLVFFMLESFRMDLVGAVHEGKAVTPNLNVLAEKGVFSRQAYSHNGYTVQSRYHVFTGNLMSPGEGTSLIDDFKENGYEVAYFSGQDESFGEDKMPIGVERVDTFYDGRSNPERRYTTFSTPGSLGLPFTVLLEKVQTFLHERKGDRPLLLYINFYDSHFPYRHDEIEPLMNAVVLKQSEIHSDRKAELQAMYLNTAANVDRAIGRVLAGFRQLVGEVPAVLVLADHGESLFEDGFLGHGYKINDAQTRIPLIVTDIPLLIEEPFGQVSLRAALSRALSQAPTLESGPRIESNPQKKVFQYIGAVERPRQIALTGLDDRMTYDFRSGRVQSRDTRWRRPNELAPSEYRAFQQLVYYWESSLLSHKKESG